MSKSFGAWIVLAGVFALYLTTTGPSVVPYRDAGEMATSVPQLGVLHPTGYPLYAVGGAVAARVPLGNPAYRLNVFSALCMAAMWALLWLLWAQTEGRGVAFAVVALGACSYYFWWHALVSEMYALNALFIAALLSAYAHRRILLWAFLLGLGLANRADLLLTLPAFALGFWMDPAYRPQRTRRMAWALLACGLCGLVLYAYLPLRALQQPWMNWDDPSTWERFLHSVLRRGYGSGLDLLSSSYATGENFASEMALYLAHLWRDFAYLGIPLALGGVWRLWRERRPWAMVLLVGWLITGPLFIFLGNLPPNTHAVAILQAAYLVPDVFFLAVVAAGLGAFSRTLTNRVAQWGVCGAVLALAAWNGLRVGPEVNQRQNYLAVDYSRNVYASVPAPAVLVGRSDVPLFSLYYGHWGPAHAIGRVPIGQGLAASPWYQTMLRRDESGLQISMLRDAADWAVLQRQNPSWGIYACEDIDWPKEGTGHFSPRGLVNAFAETPPADQAAARALSRRLLSTFYVYRGVYVYGHYRDFFSNELIEAYARAWMFVNDEAGWRAAWAMKPDLPYAPFQLAYTFYSRGDFATAARYYAATLANFDRLEAEADAWKTLPDLRQPITADHRLALQHWNAVQSRLHAAPRANVQ